MLHFQLKKQILKIQSAVLVVAMIGSIIIIPQKASADIASCTGGALASVTAARNALRAQDVARVPVTDGTNADLAAVNAGATTGSTFKTCIMDPLAYMIARRAIDQITQDTINWINNGFEGSPAFVQNPTKFLTGVGDKIVGDILEQTQLGFLCAPFRLNLGLSLVLGRGPNYVGLASTCTLSGAIANVENFTKFTGGDWSQGGWGSFIQVSQSTSNDPVLAKLMLNASIDAKIANKQEEQTNMLNWGGGFLSKTKCTPQQGPPSPTGEALPDICTVVTPGKIIQQKLSDTLGTDVRQLELADSFDKIINALLNQLIKQAVFSAQGLSGGGR